ncbi:MAG TPA: 4-alpha-glucanotransferase [Steroidobacteraceae bacterium]|nr:4-alpha-glucanotransferase [Steroidobacteraceae bacterium]
MDPTLIERLARLRGIGDAYHDYRGELRHFSLATKTGLLRAMGCKVDEPAALALELSQLEMTRGIKFLPTVATARSPRISIDVNIHAREFGSALLWSVRLEDGSRRDGAISTADCPELWRGEIEGSWITRRRLELPIDLPIGYHELEARTAAGAAAGAAAGGATGAADRCLLIISPPQCYEPAPIAAGGRLWGIAVQLYTLRSRDNWGIGDFNDLRSLIGWVASHGAGFVGLNPLHALAPADPERSSPYSGSSRHFLNALYIAVPLVPEFQDCAAARERLAEPSVVERLRELRDRELVDYRGVADLKFEILALLYRDFRERHLARGTGRAHDFRAFVAAGGEPLQMHARFDALDRHFRAALGVASGWLNWPAEFRDVNGTAAARYADTHCEEVEFYAYLQWLAHEQLCAAQALARELGMPIGLYGDYAVGANPAGSETWLDQSSYCMGAEIGAPPDPLALKGQGWGIPPQDPSVMLAQRLQGFVRLIRNNMRYYGALRLDHVMALFRLWWVAAGSSPTEGAYVHYPLQQLLTVLSLESARRACLVVGEDLGVVPDELRRAMPDFGLYHYKVLLFEKSDGRFRRPDEYVRRALATVTTHDMPTLRSFWEGRDIELRRRLNLYPSAEIEKDVIRERERDRELLLEALHEQGLKPARPTTPFEPFTAELAHTLHLYLARSATALVALQIEDLLGMTEPVNVPGTDREYPNWQRKVTASIEEMSGRADLAAQFAEIRRARE